MKTGTLVLLYETGALSVSAGVITSIIEAFIVQLKTWANSL